ncbi:MAG: DUF4363 family protein [Clostridia bacterium]|nr:DUF4363 family protein [Clostridia bacterium]
MIKNGSFNAMKAAVITALLISAALLILSCALPYYSVKNLYDRSLGYIESAKQAALSGDMEAAYLHSLSLVETIEKGRNALLLYYDHGDVAELAGTADTALDLAKARDAGLLLAALGDTENMFLFLIEKSSISIFNIF